MKIKLFILGLALGTAFLSGCDDNLGQVGTSIQDDGDKITIYVDTFQMTATTVLMDSLYAKTPSGLLGELYDPLYGNIKCDYISQFYCPDDFSFKQTPIDGVIDSMDFSVAYVGSIGDTLAPMRVQLYKVTEPLKRNFYTNVNPEEFCDRKTILGGLTYTAFDKSIPDSVRNDDDFQTMLSIRLPRELGQSLYSESVKGNIKTQEDFNKFLPGIYVTNTFGTGNILQVTNSWLNIYYKYTATTKDKQGNDSTYVANGVEMFNVTDEVIQLNRFKNTDIDHLLEPNDEMTFMKTPAGVCTRLVIPTKEIGKKIGTERVVNDLVLKLKTLPQDDWKYALTPPKYLLILPEDSVAGFFEKNMIENGKTSFLSNAYNDPYYSVGNISSLLKNQLDKDPEKDLVLMLIPVTRTTSTSGYSQTEYTTSLSHYLSPSGVKIRKDGDLMRIVVKTTGYNKKDY